MAAQKIGRFEVVRELGIGERGVVYLAWDPQFDRQVAIKTLPQVDNQAEVLAKEAAVVAQLRHTNIVTLFEATEHEGMPYFAYAFVDGHTVAHLLEEQGHLSLKQSAEIACGVLDGLACAHAHDVPHLDINPANVMINHNKVAMVMDFGLTHWVKEHDPVEDALEGDTPRYAAPELVDGQGESFLADVYAVGVLLYEMASGKSAAAGEDLHDLLAHSVNESHAVSSVEDDSIDADLKEIILKAVEKSPDARYHSAQDMKQALLEYLSKNHEEHDASNDENGALGVLLRRMRGSKDFPTISGSIAEINRIAATDSSNTGRLTSAILQDFALTSRLLQVVNAAMYAQFSGSINTVSKAVSILGFETVRSIASSLVLVDFLQNKQQAAELKEDTTCAILASVVAAQLAVGHDIHDAEEIMICAMFFNLGKLLASYYFHEESLQIATLVKEGETEDAASKKILGLSYHEFGIGVAKSWNFSRRVLTGMSKLEVVQKPENELDTLVVTVNLANELCEVGRSSEAQHKFVHISKLIKRYSAALKVTERILTTVLDSSLNAYVRRSNMLGFKSVDKSLIDKIRTWNGKALNQDYAAVNSTPDALSEIEQLGSALKSKEEEMEAFLRTAHSEQILGAGIQDVTNSMLGKFTMNDIMQIVLESIYRGMGLDRAIILLRDRRANAMVARYGLGLNVESVIPKLRFSLDFVPDVFHLAMTKGLDIAIDDTKAANIANKIPDWYKKNINAASFLLLPAMIDGGTFCMFYADKQKSTGLNPSQQQLTLLRTLRNQVILAMRQKTPA